MLITGTRAEHYLKRWVVTDRIGVTDHFNVRKKVCTELCCYASMPPDLQLRPAEYLISFHISIQYDALHDDKYVVGADGPIEKMIVMNSIHSGLNGWQHSAAEHILQTADFLYENRLRFKCNANKRCNGP